jgi:FkbM family methyltransferase
MSEGNFISKVKSLLTGKIINFLSGSNYFTERFFSRNRSLLMESIFEYPSIVNNGYLHIERTIILAELLGIAHNKIIVDAGAADGVISKMFAEKFSDCKIYSFEPVSKTYEILSENTIHCKNLNRINKALGSDSGESEIHILERITSSSILNISDTIEEPFFAEALKENSTEKISITTLDREIPSSEKVAILKMDVQGYEMEILKGGINTLKNTDMILLEMQNHQFYKQAPMYYDLDAFLRSQNFECWDLIPSIRKGNKLMEWDAIYISKKHSKSVHD